MSEWPPKASIDPTLLALLKHLAVGPKHFKPTDPRLQGVADVKTNHLGAVLPVRDLEERLGVLSKRGAQLGRLHDDERPRHGR
jgi:hypothetical protein